MSPATYRGPVVARDSGVVLTPPTPWPAPPPPPGPPAQDHGILGPFRPEKALRA